MQYRVAKVEYLRLWKEIVALRDLVNEKEKEIQSLQKDCDHQGDHLFNADPAGGNDSWIQCLACKGEVR
jgi:hypothetical protein